MTVTPTLHALQRHRVNRSFAGGGPPDRAHLAGCAECQTRYQRLLVAEAAMPDGDRRAEERLWREIERVAAAPRPRRWMLAPLVLAAAAAIVLVARPRGDGLVARGPAAVGAPPSVHVFRAVGRTAEPVGDRIHAGDALLFAYSNPGSAYSRLMVFAEDARGQVYWYYPAYTQVETDPLAVTIEPERTGVELREAIRHPLPPGLLRLHALFLRRPVAVSEIEAQLAKGGLQEPGSHEEVWRLEVLP